MKTHASVELMEAMRGIHPLIGTSEGDTAPFAGSPACGDPHALTVWACTLGATPIKVEVDCLKCLQLMREAIPPVRWDALEERGLAPKLEAA